VTAFLDNTLGSDVSDLGKVAKLLEESELKRKAIEKRVSLNNAEHNTPKQIQETLQNGEMAMKTLNALLGQKDDMVTSSETHSKKIKDLAIHLSQLVDQVSDIQRFQSYISWIERLQEISTNIQKHLDGGLLGSAVEEFTSLDTISQLLDSSSCLNLKTFARNTQKHWYQVLVENLSSEFDEITKMLKWPFTSQSTAPPLSTKSDTFTRLERIFLLLLKLQNFKTPSNEGSESTEKERELPLPLDWLLKPLRKRFKFHFYGKKQTNNLEKPEWYFTQILNWIKSHGDFLQHTVQPVLDKAELSFIDAKLEFIRGLLAVTTEKMIHSLPELLADEAVFSHFVDETLLFHKELHELYNYPLTDHSCLKVLTRKQCLGKWVELERKYAIENMESLLASENAWRPKYEDVECGADEMRAPECAEGFITILTVMTDRYRHLPGLDEQSRFLAVQLDLLKDFITLLSLTAEESASNPVDACFISVLNATSYIGFLLEDWNDQTLFLQLHGYFSSENDSGDCGVFDEPLKSLCELQKYMSGLIVEDVVKGFRAKCKAYRKERWHSLPSPKELAVMVLSSGACDFLVYLKDRLNTLQKLLAYKLFSALWVDLARALNMLIYQEVIQECRYNEGGAAQLQFDMKNLFTLFGEYTQKPENYYKEVKECCILLNQMPGSAILLIESLQAAHAHDESTNAPQATLNEMGVYKLSSHDALRILNLRINWPKA
ncbi:predicted protein, partial [Nematostella vectensis]